ncbi:MAG TPA: pyruvate ferredoxin oxidoreductase, partial [Rhodospirillaceae bacterium]|nr:pyruvate ferredoxin oxidoreductase [Rhodospirillaceae bacterium]
ITPQTHIVEGLGELVKAGHIENCEYINVESEFAALSVAIGASAAGARAYTATSSQGLLFMAEAVYNASGLGLPIVMTLGNRAIGSPINIWNDHSDAMSMRDAGWIQLFAENNQEAVDLHIQAFRIAEDLSCPVMVCVDGFILTHAVEQVDVPSQEIVDNFVPPFVPIQVLDPKAPVTIGALVGPEAFTEVRYLDHQKQLTAFEVIAEVSEAFKKTFGREAGGLIRTFHTEDAETIIVAMGSVIGTLKDMIEEKRAQGEKIGLVSICSFRPFPTKEVHDALMGARHVIVLEKSLASGQGGVLAAHVRSCLKEVIPVTTLIAGLGGRPIPKSSLSAFVDKIKGAANDTLHFLDLKHDVVQKEMAGIQQYRASRSTNGKTQKVEQAAPAVKARGKR